MHSTDNNVLVDLTSLPPIHSNVIKLCSLDYTIVICKTDLSLMIKNL